jgi:hypothetical protein
VEIIGYMVFHGLVDVQTVNDLAGGAILSFWSRAKNWSEERRKRTGHDEFLEWGEWLATQIAQYRATRPMFLLLASRSSPWDESVRPADRTGIMSRLPLFFGRHGQRYKLLNHSLAESLIG